MSFPQSLLSIQTSSCAILCSARGLFVVDCVFPATCNLFTLCGVQCPNIGYHLAGTKKVQQALASPGGVERFVSDASEAALLRSSFAGLWGLDRGDAEKVNSLRVCMSSRLCARDCV